MHIYILPPDSPFYSSKCSHIYNEDNDGGVGNEDNDDDNDYDIYNEDQDDDGLVDLKV